MDASDVRYLTGKEHWALVKVVISLMDEAGLTQNKLAKLAGVDQSIISRSLRPGGRRLSQKHMEKIAAAFGKDPISLIKRAKSNVYSALLIPTTDGEKIISFVAQAGSSLRQGNVDEAGRTLEELAELLGSLL